MHKSAIALVIIVAACSGGPGTDTSSTTETPAVDAVEVIDQLHDYLVAGDFEAAGRITVPDQAALAALAEGASESDVADALQSGDIRVAANFWSGFAQGAGEAFLGSVELRSLGTVTEGDSMFDLVGVMPEGMMERPMATQQTGGHLVDLFASFGDGLADRMIPPVEALLDSGSDEASLILTRLQSVVDSLLVAAQDPAITPDASQSILQLVELITRVG